MSKNKLASILLVVLTLTGMALAGCTNSQKSGEASNEDQEKNDFVCLTGVPEKYHDELLNKQK